MVAGFALASVLLVGCGTETVSGEAVGASGSASAGSGPVDGCAVLPDEALVAAGFDPSKKMAPDEEHEGWAGCIISGDGVSLMTALTNMTMDEVRSDRGITDQVDVSVAGRIAVQHRRRATAIEDSCILAFDTSEGVMMLRLERKVSNPEKPDMCGSLSERAVHLVPFIPA
ncbi:DUF3558 domain-containing protein [Rhodococcus gannanensis]|uniref:DUF3558 domain-containing protein n=1 Tax=Rhodococcus gannanensis TaxID=1960308 RepID=A0ABW4P0G1_9NOCA